VVNPDNTVSMRPVVTGPTAGDVVAISKGLTAGQTVVVDGADQLRDGAKIILPGTALPGSSGGARMRRNGASSGGPGDGGYGSSGSSGGPHHHAQGGGDSGSGPPAGGGPPPS
jgi:multidrug efflux system membrane fusion protein